MHKGSFSTNQQMQANEVKSSEVTAVPTSKTWQGLPWKWKLPLSVICTKFILNVTVIAISTLLTMMHRFRNERQRIIIHNLCWVCVCKGCFFFIYFFIVVFFSGVLLASDTWELFIQQLCALYNTNSPQLQQPCVLISHAACEPNRVYLT